MFVRRWWRHCTILTLLAALTGCSVDLPFGLGRANNPPPPPASPTTAPSIATVQISNFAYNPATLTVAPGTTVQWTNQDSIPHTVTSGTPSQPTGLFGAKFPAQGDTYSFTFTTPGQFPYFCDYHPSVMIGTIIVKQP